MQEDSIHDFLNFVDEILEVVKCQKPLLSTIELTDGLKHSNGLQEEENIHDSVDFVGEIMEVVMLQWKSDTDHCLKAVGSR